MLDDWLMSLSDYQRTCIVLITGFFTIALIGWLSDKFFKWWENPKQLRKDDKE